MSRLESRTVPSLGAGMLLLFSVAAGRINGQEPEPTKDRLLRDAPRAWKSHQDFWQTLQGTSEGQRRELGKKEIQRMRSHWKRCGNNFFDQMEVISPEYDGQVLGGNSQYQFTLVRKSASKPWVVRSLQPLSADEEREVPRTLALSLVLAQGTLPRLVESPGFRLVNITKEPGSTDGLLRVDFTHSGKSALVDEALRKGSIVLDPKRDWVIRRAVLDREFGAEKQEFFIEYEYNDGPDGHPLMTKSVHRAVTTDNGKTTHSFEITAKLDVYQEKHVPESEFMLAAFGLADVPGVPTKRPTPWFLLLAAAGLTLLVLGACAYWWARRLKAT